MRVLVSITIHNTPMLRMKYLLQAAAVVTVLAIVSTQSVSDKKHPIGRRRGKVKTWVMTTAAFRTLCPADSTLTFGLCSR